MHRRSTRPPACPNFPFPKTKRAMSPPTFTRFVDRAGRRLAVGLLLVVAGCGGDQSALAPAGPIGLSIATLAWIMFAGAAVIFGVVMALTVIAWLAPLRVRRWLGTSRAVAIGGIAFPVVVLSALLVYGLCVTRTTAGSEGTGPVSINVVGEQDRKSTRLNSSHVKISYAVFCLKKKNA